MLHRDFICSPAHETEGTIVRRGMQIMQISCYFRNYNVLLIKSLTHVGCAIIHEAYSNYRQARAGPCLANSSTIILPHQLHHHYSYHPSFIHSFIPAGLKNISCLSASFPLQMKHRIVPCLSVYPFLTPPTMSSATLFIA